LTWSKIDDSETKSENFLSHKIVRVFANQTIWWTGSARQIHLLKCLQQ